MITVDPSKVSMILIQGVGWENIVPGSLSLDSLVLMPETPTSESEDYGFVAIHDSGDQIIGRISSLLAVRRAAR